MRIIAGTHKGRKINPPKKLPVRPTTDMAKEALFNILNHRVAFSEIRVMDLFAGTGSISLEFASRGCPEILAIDQHRGCVKFIETVSKQLELEISAVKADVFKYLANPAQPFDIVFADPPYAMGEPQYQVLIETITGQGWLKPEGMLIVEHPRQLDFENLEVFFEKRRYGGSVFSFFRSTAS